MNKAGDTIQSFSNKAKDKKYTLKVTEGANRFVWDMRYKGAEKLKGMILWWASLSGAKAVPGEYKISLKVNDEERNTWATILSDPRAEVTVQQMQEQFDFVTAVNETVDKAHQSIKKIRKLSEQLNRFEKQYKDDARVTDLIKQASDLKEALKLIEEALYQTQNKSGQDPLNFPIRLTNKLAHLVSLVTMDDYPPTSQDIAVKNELSKKIAIQLDQFDVLMKEKVHVFNEAFNALKLHYLFTE
jgi:predicted RND superfamily exporter protein